MNRPDYRSPAHRFANDLQSAITQTFNTSTEGRKSLKPGAHNIVAVVGGVQFTITVQEGRKR